MKLKNANTIVCVLCALACLLLMGVCPGGAWCSVPDSQADLGHAVGEECCRHIPVWHESVLTSECEAMGNLDQKCWQHCSDCTVHFGCAAGLILPNNTRSVDSALFAWSHVITDDAVLAKEELLPQSRGMADAVIPLLRTVVLLT